MNRPRGLDSILVACSMSAFALAAPGLAASGATVRGRVTAADTGQPLQGVELRICCLSDSDPVALTDMTGSYEFTDLPPGRYTVRATKAAYLRTDYGEDAEGQTAKELDVRERIVIDNIDIRLPRGGAIEGRISDEYGEPFPRVVVSAVARVEGLERLYPSGSALRATDDRGRYRLFGLPPGTYCISASSSPPGASRHLYYPGVVDPAEAKCISLGMSEEVRGIDLTLPPGPPS